jgi:Golgin subfamily A member 7/ERF4 family
MDCLFNRNIPQSSDSKIIIRPNSKTFVTGLASSYDESYPQSLVGRITLLEWASAVSRINEALFFYWPCFMCMSFAYCFCLCTAGLSFFCSGIRVNEAKNKVLEEIKDINKEFSKKGVSLKLIQKCSTSWIEVTLEEMICIDTDNSQLS